MILKTKSTSKVDEEMLDQPLVYHSRSHWHEDKYKEDLCFEGFQSMFLEQLLLSEIPLSESKVFSYHYSFNTLPGTVKPFLFFSNILELFYFFFRFFKY